ncbi:Calx-beta domain-containing protein [Psychroserpens sp. SPM9]|uniref:DUF7619 domain-containing protein n=1 Tax=Psychroserpens sp. SPM9 TaxID=2975598 RepID=UPI0021A7F274|nr:Calx-beta domain-containing protein [Psychroserpens sp. SPM9]MDG5491748.1 Calx-beta domain-containing protein [Psychroserpens sp. SPM9]
MKKIVLLLVIAFYSTFCFSQDPIVYLTNGGLNYSVIEGNTYTFSVNLFSASPTDVVVDVVTIDGSADTSDYTPISTTVTIPAGQLSSNSLSISTANDATIEDNEIFYIEATVTSNNTENSEINSQIHLFDNDATPTVYITTNPYLTEGQSYNYNVNLSNYFNSDVTIDFTTSSGTADTSDYNETNTSVTFLAGERYSQFLISTIDDVLVETDETYTITATVTSGNTTNTTIPITVTIIDNDVTPSMTVYSSDMHEGNTAYVSVNLNRAFSSDIIVQLSTSNGTADLTDYTSVNQTKTILPGNYGVNFQIPTLEDTLDEADESVNYTVTILSGNTTNTLETGAFDILDDDGLPNLRLRAVYDYENSQNYGDSIAVEEGYPLKFRVLLSEPSPVDTAINITTSFGTADASDLTSSTLTTIIPAGQLFNYQDDLNYPTILDQLDEDDENLFITAEVSSGNTYNSSVTEEAFILDNYALNAQQDRITSILEVGTTFQVLDNDTFEGLPVVASNLNVSLVGSNTIGVTLSSTGLLTIPANAPFGNHYLNYEICDAANPTNCDIASLLIRVESPLEVSSTVTYVDFNGDGFTSVGDTIEYLFTVTNNGNADITNIDADVSFPDLDIVGGPLASLAPGQTDTTTFTATHIITQDDINFGYYGGDQEGINFYGAYYNQEVWDNLYNPNQNFQLPQSDGIELKAFVDTNSNGIQDSGEINFPLGHFNYEVNNDGVIHNLYVSPHYLYESNPNTTYNLNYTVDSDYAGNNTTTSYTNVTVPVGSGITTYNFPITVTPYDDLSVNLSSNLNAAVPGFNYSNYMTFTNNSNLTVPSGTINFTIDEALNLINVYDTSQNWYTLNPVNFVTTADGFSYTFSNLEPYETRTLRVLMSVPTLPTVSLGQLVTNSVDIELLSGDILPLNNTSSLTQTIVGSYDPNDITERHGPEIVHSEFTTNDYLTYTIRFENTGTANAINIRIEDLLDEQLDESTLKMIGASHDYTLERVGKSLEWNFFGINLPPSEADDSTVGHGYLTFKIKPFPDYAIGDIIPNTADIYFDFNPAIVTNTWLTEFVEDNLSVTEVSFESLKVYPIPANDQLYIENNTAIDSVRITSVLGKEVMLKVIEASTAEIDVTPLTSGIYFVTLSSNGNKKTIKIIKE